MKGAGEAFATTEAGKRLKRYVLAVMAGHEEIRTVSELCRRAGLNRNTIYDWFTGAAVPSPSGIAKLAAALDVSMGDIYAAYDGRMDLPTTTDVALSDLARDIRDQSERIDTLIGLLRGVATHAVADEVVRALSDKKRGRQAAPIGI